MYMSNAYDEKEEEVIKLRTMTWYNKILNKKQHNIKQYDTIKHNVHIYFRLRVRSVNQEIFDCNAIMM